MKLNRSTIGRYLKKGNKLNWCTYNKEIVFNEIGNKNRLSNSSSARKVVVLNFRKVFNCIKEGAYFYNIKTNTNYSNISECCRGKRDYAYKLEDGTPLVWVYWEDYIKMNENDIFIKLREPLIPKYNNYKKLICITTNKIFETIKNASEYYNCCSRNISKVCNGTLKHCGKLEDGTKLQWKYIKDLTQEEYIKYDIENKLKELHNQELVQAC
jgi:hypothetical protein